MAEHGQVRVYSCPEIRSAGADRIFCSHSCGGYYGTGPAGRARI